MNLKEAFRYQNKLQQLMQEAKDLLSWDRNVTKVTMTHLRHKVMAEAENETIIEAPETDHAEHITELASFLLLLLEQREQLSRSIRRAKQAMEMDFDSEISLNSDRQALGRLFQHMGSIRSAETVIANGGTGYRFNAEGNQVQYRCDLKKVTTINFDRNRIRAMADAMFCQAEKASAALDQCLVNTEVDYAPPFTVNATFDEAFGWYLAQQT